MNHNSFYVDFTVEEYHGQRIPCVRRRWVFFAYAVDKFGGECRLKRGDWIGYIGIYAVGVWRPTKARYMVAHGTEARPYDEIKMAFQYFSSMAKYDMPTCWRRPVSLWKSRQPKQPKG